MTEVVRYRLRFRKTESARFLSHRDLIRLFERAGRRAGLPLALTQGFNPHPRISIPLALKVGACGLREVAEIDLTDDPGPDRVAAQMDDAMPPGVAVESARRVPAGRRARPVAQRVEGRLPLSTAEQEALAGAEPPDGVTELAVSGEGLVFLAPATLTPSKALQALLGEARAAQVAVVRRDILFEGAGP